MQSLVGVRRLVELMLGVDEGEGEGDKWAEVIPAGGEAKEEAMGVSSF